MDAKEADERELTARINRIIANHPTGFLQIRKRLGRFRVVNVTTGQSVGDHIDLDGLARDLGVL